MTIIAHFIDILELVVIAISVIVVRKQIKETHEWNRIKTTQEVLSGVAQGPAHNLMHTIRVKYCDVAATPMPSYDDILKRLPDDKATEFRSSLMKLLNIFESIAIAIRHHVIDEDIAYDYLGKVMTTYHDFANTLIDQRRKLTKFERAAGSLEYVANRWRKRLENEAKIVDDELCLVRGRRLVRAKPPLGGL